VKDRLSIENFRQLADYNHWANRRLYAVALALPDEQRGVPAPNLDI
jgi:uncharacterized damage-inducible protein DinB